MTREVLTTLPHMQAEEGVRGQGGPRPAAHLVVAVLLFTMLMGIWACLWVPPSWAP